MVDGLFIYADKILGVAGLIGTAFIWLLLARLRQEFPSKSDLRGLEGRHEAADARITGLEKATAVIEARLENVPTHADVSEIKTALAGIGASQSAAQLALATMQEQLTLLLHSKKA